MKLLSFLIVLAVGLTARAYAQTNAYVLTLGVSNTTANTLTIRGNVAAGGTNATMWFEWGTLETALNTATTNVTIGVSTSTNQYSYTLTGLTAGAKYFYRVAATNAFGVVRGSIWPAFTTQTGYNYETGTGLTFDETRPSGSELASLWDDVARETRAAVKDFGLRQHNIDGTHLDGFLRTTMVGDGAITWDKLDAVTKSNITAGVVTSNLTLNATITNSLVYMWSQETAFTEVAASNNVFQIVASAVVPSNTYSRVKFEFEARFNSTKGSSVFWSPTLKTVLGPVKAWGTFRVGPNRDLPFSGSFISPVGANYSGETITIDVLGADVDPTKNSTQIQNFRIWGIP